MTITTDLDEGRYCDVTCRTCGFHGATLRFAHPVRMYVVAIVCDECGDELVTFDQFTGETK